MRFLNNSFYSSVHNEVKELYIQAARMNPRHEIDPDVQCGLGVLFSLVHDYEKAADCFKTALQICPNVSTSYFQFNDLKYEHE